MIYATTIDAIDYLSALRLAEITGYVVNVNVATDPVTGDAINLFSDAVLGNDLSGYTPQQQADVALAVAILQKSLNSANSLVSSYISQQYPLPLTSFPEWLTEAAVSFSNCSLHDDKEIEAISKKCEHFKELLNDVAKGKLKLYPATDEEENVVSPPRIAVESPPRVFTEETLNKVI